MKQKNKWVIEMDDHYRCGDQVVIRTDMIAIPPTNGDRTDLIVEFNGKRTYLYNTTKEQFMQKLSKEEYLEKCLPGLNDKQKREALKNIDFAERKYHGQISLIIEIKKGEVKLKTK